MMLNRLRSGRRYYAVLVPAILAIISACTASGVDLPTPTPVFSLPPATATQQPDPTPTAEPSPSPRPPVPLTLAKGNGTYLIPLHLQHKAQQELVVMFDLAVARLGRLYWWPVDGASDRANFQEFSDETSRHVIRITGLQPGQRYSIAVGLPEEDGRDRLPGFADEVWGPIEVSTLPSTPFPLTIGVFGDSGFGEELTRRLAQELSSHDPDLVLHTGDLVYLAYQEGNPLAAYQRKWYGTLKGLLKQTVIYPVVGNHEYDGDVLMDGAPYYFKAFPMPGALEGGWQMSDGDIRREWYALDLGPLQVLLLNSQQLYGGSARQEQDAWLNARLADERFEATVVVFHIPPFTSGRHRLDGAAVLSSWVPDFEASNVFLVLSGHDHNYERLQRNGITYIVSGGGSSVVYPLEERVPESQFFVAASHFVTLEIAADQVQIKAYDIEGDPIDALIIEWGERSD